MLSLFRERLSDAGVPALLWPARTVYGLAVDAEPGECADRAAIRAHAEAVVRGLEAIRVECGASRGVLLVRPGDRRTTEAAERAVGDSRNLAIEEALPVYPATPPGSPALPAELLRHIAAALEGRPMTARLVAIGGEVAAPAVLELPIGTRFGQALAFGGGPLQADARIDEGGVATARVASASEPIGKQTRSILAQSVARPTCPAAARLRLATESCMQCRLCTDACPPAQLGARIAPHRALLAAGSERIRHEASLCTRCGVCFLVCPYGLDPRAAYETTGVPFATPPATEEAPPRRLPLARLERRAPPSDTQPEPVLARAPEVHEVAVPLGGGRACVPSGTVVTAGQVIAQGPLRAHAPIPGRITAVLSDRIVIAR